MPFVALLALLLLLLLLLVRLTSFGCTKCAQTIHILVVVVHSQVMHVHCGHVQKGV